MCQRLAHHPPSLSGREAAGKAVPGSFGVQTIKTARIPATRQGARERRWKRHGPGLLICLSITGALERHGSAGRWRRGRARPFCAPGQRTSRSPFVLGTEGRAGGGSRRVGSGEGKFRRCLKLGPGVALDPGTFHRPWGRPGPPPRSDSPRGLAWPCLGMGRLSRPRESAAGGPGASSTT